MIDRETVVGAIQHRKILENRFSDWCDAHVNCSGIASAPVDTFLTDKATLRARPERFANVDTATERLAIKYTSGTTGPPVPILYDWLTHLEQMVILPRRIIALYSAIAPRIETIGCTVTLSVTDNASVREEIWVDPWGGFVVQIVVDEANPVDCRRVGDLVPKLKPDLVTVKPNLLAAILDHETRCEPFKNCVGLVAVSGSDFGETVRASFEARLGAPVIEAYGLTEFGLVASECEARAGLHVDPDIWPEILNAQEGTFLQTNGQESSVSEGELVLSSGRNTAFPLTRYRTGDLATVVRAPCSCGRSTPRLRALSGRLVENFQRADGRTLSPARFNSLFATFPIFEFQLTQPGCGTFELTVEPQSGETINLGKLRSHMYSLVGKDSQLIIKVDSISRSGKFQRFRKSPNVGAITLP